MYGQLWEVVIWYINNINQDQFLMLLFLFNGDTRVFNNNIIVTVQYLKRKYEYILSYLCWTNSQNSMEIKAFTAQSSNYELEVKFLDIKIIFIFILYSSS